MVVRLREAAIKTGVLDTLSWISGDEIVAEKLPLAMAVERVLASMQGVLERTMEARDAEMKGFEEGEGPENEKRRYLAETKAAEVRVVRNVDLLRNPTVECKAQRIEL